MSTVRLLFFVFFQEIRYKITLILIVSVQLDTLALFENTHVCRTIQVSYHGKTELIFDKYQQKHTNKNICHRYKKTPKVPKQKQSYFNVLKIVLLISQKKRY